MTLMRRLFLLAAAFAIPAAAQARDFTEQDIPDVLKPWVGWVTYDVDRNDCPFVSGRDAGAARSCVWYGALRLSLDETGGSFALPVTVYQKDSIVPLPGNERVWPVTVTVNGNAAAVTEQQGVPALTLQPGQYLVSGSFIWQGLPDMLQLPAGAGVIDARIHGEAVSPEIDDGNAWWLNRRQKTEQVQEDRLEITPFRHIADDIPLTMDTRLLLHVSGSQREAVIPHVLLPDFVPMELTGGLPARLEPDGSLRVQLRPGEWNVNLRARSPKPVETLTLDKDHALADQEVWVFEAQPGLRLSQVEGARSIDPSQTQLPPEWQSFPAYLMTPGDSFTIAEKKRGMKDAGANQLSLARDLWLHFDGKGLTARDQIHGFVRSGDRLNALPGLTPGRVTINGQDQFITTLGDAKTVGVEVRPGPIDMTAESRMKGYHALSAVGWDTDVSQLSATLHLPPGWRLFTATGVDRLSSSWVMQWTLYDVFLVLITIVAAFRLLSRGAAVVFAVGLALIHPEFPAVTGLLLLSFALMALMRVLPKARFYATLLLARRVVILGLALAMLPFIILHLREAIYPQLEQPVAMPYGASGMAGAEMQNFEAARAPEAVMAAPMMVKRREMMKESAADMAGGFVPPGAPVPQPLYQYDPDSKIQTGYGIAQWRGRDIALQWNGPVSPSQQLKLWLLSPAVNLALAIMRALLLVAMLAAALGVPPTLSAFRELPQRWKSQAALFLAAFLLIPHAANAESPFPPDEMLKQLRERLVTEWNKAPDCLPQCASVSRTILQVQGDQLAIQQEIHVRKTVAVPLPGPASEWRPILVVADDRPVTALRLEDGRYLYAVLPEGVHRIQMVGSLPSRDTVSIDLPLASRITQAEAAGWDVQGIERERATSGVRLARTGAAVAEDETLTPGVLPPFFTVSRQLTLGIDWRAETVVSRVTPVGSAVTAQVPLLPGESVLTPGITVKDGKAIVTFNAQTREVRWESQLPQTSALTLTAPKDVAWAEAWRINASTLWHAEYEGLPPVAGDGSSATLFRPWPGESLSVAVTRPKGVEGQTLTIDSSNVNYSVGTRSLESTLTLTLRSSQGGQHEIRLPADAILTQANMNGMELPLQMKQGAISLPIAPGVQTANLTFKQDRGITTMFRAPRVDLNHPSVNADISMTLPRDRWVLLAGGPAMGPAVLFWGVLPVLLIAAFVLGKIKITPLHGWQWFLLLLGLSQSPLGISLAVVAWLLVLGWRDRAVDAGGKNWLFNLRQVALGLLTLAALSSLFAGIKRGLLGSPDMAIEGSGSSSYFLHWYQDIVTSVLPEPWVLSLPVLVYRGLMLLWALWLAFALIRWLQWGWKAFASGGYWKEPPPKPKEPKMS